MSERNDEVIEALKPFARVADLTERMPGFAVIWNHSWNDPDESFQVTIDDCRKARSVLHDLERRSDTTNGEADE
jgi:hypothetical protein